MSILFCASSVHASDADTFQSGHSLCSIKHPSFHVIFLGMIERKDWETLVLLPPNLGEELNRSKFITVLKKKGALTDLF